MKSNTNITGAYNNSPLGESRPVVDMILEANHSELDEFDDELDWNAQIIEERPVINSEPVRLIVPSKSEVLEEQKEQQYMSSPDETLRSEPISLSEINDVFNTPASPMVNTLDNDEQSLNSLETDTTPNYSVSSKGSSNNLVNGRLSTSRKSRSPTAVPVVKPTKLQAAERVRELRLKQTVQNIAGKLKWHDEDSELKEDTLAEVVFFVLVPVAKHSTTIFSSAGEPASVD